MIIWNLMAIIAGLILLAVATWCAHMITVLDDLLEDQEYEGGDDHGERLLK